MLRFRWSRLRRRCGDGAAAIDEAIVEAAPWRWRTGRLNQRDDEMDDGSSFGEVDEGRQAIAVDNIVGQEDPAGPRWGGKRQRVEFRGWSGEVMAAWDFECRKGGDGRGLSMT